MFTLRRGDRRRSSRPTQPRVEGLEGRALLATSLVGPFVPGVRPELAAPVYSLNTGFLKGAARPQAVNAVRPQAVVVRTVPAAPAPTFQAVLNPPGSWQTTLMFRR
jgi:hypothetical protein